MAAKRGIRAYSLFIRFVRVVLGVYLKLRFNIKAENHGLIARLKPPYLVLPNHVGFWDPFMVSIFVPQAIHWVAADANFRSGVLRRFLSLVGAIPKAKAVTDFEAIRYILSVRESGGVVGVFAEGQRTWHGATLPLLYSTAKLVRLMKSPVVTPIFLGGYFSHPRWSHKPRRGRLTVQFKLTLTAEETRSLSVDEIYDRLTAALAHDDYAYQSQQTIPYRGKGLAEDLEHTLFVCPACRGMATLRSRDSRFGCRRCGYAVRYTETGFLIPEREANEAGFETIRDWHRWQLAELPSLIEEGVAAYRRDGTPILEDVDIQASRGYRSSRLTRLGSGTLRLLPDRLAFSLATDDGAAESLEIPLEEIRGLNVQLTRHLELYYKGELYVFFPESRKVSAYKWQNAVETLSKRNATKEH